MLPLLERLAAVDSGALLGAVRAEQWRRSFYRFFCECAWPAINPGTPYQENWHIAAICDYLQALHNGEIRNLIVNIPFRLLKSSIISQAFPAWEWALKPQTEYFTASYSKDLATRDATKSRDIIKSLQYQNAFGHVFSLSGDQNVKTRYANDQSGTRVVSSPESQGTGLGGNRVIIDDPVSAADASNINANVKVVEWWKAAASTRLNNVSVDSIIVTHQRTFPDDLTGYLLGTEPDFVVLKLPMRYDPAIISLGACVYADPRRKPGELLFPARINEAEVRKMEQRLGPFHTASQLQQDPVYREGSMFEVNKLRFVDRLPEEAENGLYARGWDLAATEDDLGAAYTVGVRAVRHDDITYVLDMVRGQWASERVRAEIKGAANRDGTQTHVTLPQDPGQAGKAQARTLVGMLSGYVAEATPESGDKVTRADAPAAQVSAGNVVLLRGHWNVDFVEGLRTFPNSTLKDVVDAFSRVWHYLDANASGGSAVASLGAPASASYAGIQTGRAGFGGSGNRAFR